MEITKEQKRCREDVLKKCWSYLRDNFHKFNQANKIKVALALCTKDLLDDGINGSIRQLIIIRPINGENQTEDISGRLHLQPEAVPGNVELLGHRKDDVLNISGHVVQRADTAQPGSDLQEGVR
jgi:hypothetical protein